MKTQMEFDKVAKQTANHTDSPLVEWGDELILDGFVNCSDSWKIQTNPKYDKNFSINLMISV